ncbi:MAG: hypothetical protein QG657_3980, partial [Acidobacteriota bacterium]|nr:hypothetical protein [Acidobacteriota bacterium]
FGVLSSGASLWVVTSDEIRDPKCLSDIIVREQVTFWDSAPAVLQQVADLISELNISAIKTSLRLVFLSGDWIPVSLPGILQKAFTGVSVISLGGATEATVWSNYFPINTVNPSWISIPYGKPIQNARYYILDSQMNICPIGVCGDLYIGGECLASGYINDIELTAGKFVDNPFAPGERMYKTGDLARWFEDGNMEFLGRKDSQVKIRGYRIELGEIESQLEGIEGVKEAIVVVKTAAGTDRYLCAYFVSDREIDKEELRKSLLKELPNYMIPPYFIRLEKIPLTPNGKVDRNALPEPQFIEENKYAAPRDKVEKTLAVIWSEVLSMAKDRIGIDFDFFELGGHSLNAAVVISRIHKELDVKIPLAEIFNRPTIRELAETVMRGRKEKYAAIELVEEKEYYVLSSAQMRLYVLQRMEPENTVYNIPQIMVIEGDIDKRKLEETFLKLIRRHESLRTSFEVIAGEPVQRIHDTLEFEIEYKNCNLSTDYTDYTDGRGDPAWSPDIIRSFIRPFDLSKAPLMRVSMVKNGEQNHLLMVDIHHIVSDGISHAVLMQDFMAFYAGVKLPAIGIQYKDFSEWQRGKGERGNIKKQQEYWLKQFEGETPVLDIPTDYPRPKTQSFEGNSVKFQIEKNVMEELKALALRMGVTLFMVLESIFDVVLSKMSNQEDILVGTPVAGRRHADLERVIGMFVNTLVLRSQPLGILSFAEFLGQVKERTLQAFENQDYPFEELVEHVAVTRDISRNPLFDVLFVLQNMEVKAQVEEPGGMGMAGLRILPYEYENKTSKFDLILTAIESEGKLLFTVEYCSRLFKESTIVRFINFFKRTISGVIENPGRKLFAVEIISEEERKEILLDFNNTDADYPQWKTVHELFAEQAARTPDSVGLVGDVGHVRPVRPVSLTYRKLNEQSDRLAWSLIEKGVLADNIVGIILERSIEMVIGIFGILKAGGAYLPIDPSYPPERIQYILGDSNAKILLGMEECQKEIIGNCKREGSPEAPYHHSNLAYVIYTSGSTGKPKGVLIQHGAVVNRLNWMQQMYSLGSNDIILQKTSFTFDVSVWELFWWSFYGARLCLLGPGGEKDPAAIIKSIVTNHITTMHFVPSMLNAFLVYLESSQGSYRFAGLRQVFASGEALGASHVEQFYRLMKMNGGCRVTLINLYGPTEATVDVSYYNCSADRHLDTVTAPIGKPIHNIRLYIVNSDMGLQPIGIAGELCIAGVGLARGYLNRPELTNQKFLEVSEPFFKKVLTRRRLYKTGDLVRWLSDGNIEFLGRIDQQVKIRGFRVELGEIENLLLNYLRVKDAVVTVRSDDAGNKTLVAYFVADTGVSDAELRNYLLKDLPDYMIPTYFVRLEKLPLTSSGKIDRKVLPAPRLEPGEEYSTPRNEIEKKLVEIWENVLGVANIGINDNFFAIGGDSIKIIQIASRMNTAGYKLDVKDIFRNSKISVLAPLVQKQQRVIDQSEVTGIVTLTPIQRWFFENIGVDPHHFNQVVMLYSREGFEKQIIETVFTRIQEHHDALRNTFHRDADSGEVIQIGHGLEYPRSLREYDLKNQENSLTELDNKINEIQAGIDLEKGPLMKLGLFHLDDGDRLLIAIHHLVVDGISWRILFEDLAALYTRYARGEKPVLPPKTDSYKHWSEKLSAYANSKTFLKEKNYWQKMESEEASAPPIPKDFEVGDNYIKNTGVVSFTLIEEETERLLTKVNAAFGTEMNDILLTALALGIKKTFGQDRVLIALEGHGRENIFEEMDISRTVGWFTGLFPVLLDVSYADDTGRQLKEIKEILRNFPHKGVGYGILKYLTGAENKKGLEFKLKPQIIFNYLGQFDADLNRLAFCKMAGEPVGNTRSLAGPREFDIDVSAIISNNRLGVNVSYNETHFKKGTMDTLMAHFQAELHHIVAYCAARETMEFTPGDFTFKGLAIADIDRLMTEYPGLEDIYTLTPMQEGMLFHALVDESSYSYFEQVSLRMEGELDISLVERSLNDLFKRHDILRTVFVGKDIVPPVQVVLKERNVNFHYEDLSMIEDTAKENFIREFKEKDKQRSFDLSKDVLMRVSVFRLERAAYKFIWSFHHILMDGWCLGILNSEFLEIYNSHLEKRECRLPGIKPYRSYIRWLEKRDKDESARYWSNYLESYDEPAVIPRTTVVKRTESGFRHEIVSFIIDREKTAELNKLAAVNHVTLNTVLQAMWGIILGKYNGKEDVVFGSVVSGRPYELTGVEAMVGLFINTIPVRIQYGGELGFNRLLPTVQEEAIAGEPHHYHPLVGIQAMSPLKENLFDHLFIFENFPLADRIEGLTGEGCKDNTFSPKMTDVEVFEQTNYDFNVEISASDQINITFQYNGYVYDADMVKRIGSHFREAVDRVIDDEGII